ncbi:putative quinone oxidoreductase [Cyberlindnera fabianii]|uniref:Probable quinone oxidoreductase n=1 Tax=Cyberlindnera fabianii TaxID=36022 RepID=A0A1V2L9Q2_CYBFA|nr:putative quinone oxidoreductase [Cyberlindnera fabianii]
MSSEIPQFMKAIRIHETGESLDVLKYEDVPVPSISEDEILIKNKYAGVNYVENYYRIGLYPCDLPNVLGREASGIVVKAGKNVSRFAVGDLISYGSPATFAQYTKFNPTTGKAFKLPADSSEEKLQLYGGLFIQGFTALTFITEAYEVKKDDYILVHAAAGGVGLLLNQLISKRGAHVIATASTEEKLQLAKAAGAEYLINSKTDDIVSKVLEITGGKGVAASFDSVGKDTFEISLAALARKGTLVSFGNASGPVPPVNLGILAQKNLKVLRPILGNYITTDEEWAYYSPILRELVESGELKLDITKIYDLENYKQAAADLEGRKTTGKLLLKIPE